MFKKLWNRYAVLLMIAAVPFATTGCFDRQELEQQAFVVKLGLDAAPGGLIDCTFRLAMPVNPAAGGKKGGKEPLAGAVPVTFRAHSINEAMLLANSSIERTISFSHLTNIVFGRELAEKGILQYIQPLVRFREFRRTTLFCVSSTTARDIISQDKPMIEGSVARMADSIAMVGTRTGLFPTVHIHDLISAIENPHEDIVAPLYAVNPRVEPDPLAKKGIQGDGNINYMAGDILTVGGNPVEESGAAVFRGDKVVDFISGKENIYLSLLRGVLHDAKLDMQDPLNKNKHISVVLRKHHTPNFQVTLGKPMRVSITLPVDADITNIATGTDYAEPELRQRLESSLSSELSRNLTNVVQRVEVKDKADCIPISKYARSQFPTHQAFTNYPWIDQLKNADIKIQGVVHVRRFGVQMEPLRIKD